MLNKYPKDVNLLIKHFPLRMHKAAEAASVAALAAARQDKYLEMSRAMLKEYKKLSPDTIRKHAEKLGLDMEKFDKDRQDPALKRIPGQDMALGRTCKVRGVPSMFLNGRSIRGRTLQDLSRQVDQELKKK